MPKIPGITVKLKFAEVRIHHLKPGDMLAIMFQRHISMEEHDDIIGYVRGTIGLDLAVNPILILDGGAALEVVRDNEER